ncbi:Uncharacterised protein [Vibrio cholerae]|nr:Uncharacterised protein [Vibrio cholerae]
MDKVTRHNQSPDRNHAAHYRPTRLPRTSESESQDDGDKSPLAAEPTI